MTQFIVGFMTVSDITEITMAQELPSRPEYLRMFEGRVARRSGCSWCRGCGWMCQGGRGTLPNAPEKKSTPQ